MQIRCRAATRPERLVDSALRCRLAAYVVGNWLHEVRRQNPVGPEESSAACRALSAATQILQPPAAHSAPGLAHICAGTRPHLRRHSRGPAASCAIIAREGRPYSARYVSREGRCRARCCKASCCSVWRTPPSRSTRVRGTTVRVSCVCAWKTHTRTHAHTRRHTLTLETHARTHTHTHTRDSGRQLRVLRRGLHDGRSRFMARCAQISL